MGGNTLQPYHRRWFERVVKELNDIGVNYYLEPMNEADALDWPEEYFVSWHKWAVETLRELGVPKERIIASAGRAWQAIADQVGIYAVHGYVRPEKLVDIPYPHERILISGDGGFDGEGVPDAKGRRGIGTDQAEAMAKRIIEMNYAGYELLDRGMYRKNNDRANLDDFKGEVVGMVVKVARK